MLTATVVLTIGPGAPDGGAGIETVSFVAGCITVSFVFDESSGDCSSFAATVFMEFVFVVDN